MYRLSFTTLGDRLETYFYPLAIAAVLAILSAVALYLSTQFAIFGLYALFGLVGGATVYYRTAAFDELSRDRINERIHRYGVYIVSSLTLGVVVLTREPLVVGFGLLIGYTLLIRQFVSRPTPERLLPQLTALFLLSPAVKYLTVGQYIGHGDLLFHVGLVEDIMREHTIAAIATTSYYDVPGLHIVAATVSSVSGFGAYEGVMLTGLAAFSIAIPAMYLVALRLTGRELLALSGAIGVAVLNDLSFFVSYVFPQSIATIMVLVLLVLGSMVSRDEIKWPVAGLFVLGTLGLAMTHHLTQVLFLPTIACFVSIYLLSSSVPTGTLLKSRQFALLGVALLINGVVLWQIEFFGRLYDAAVLLVQGGIFGGYSQGITIGLGMTPPSSSMSLAIDWLFSPYALYLVLLLVVFSIGVVTFIRHTNHSAGYVALGCTGLVGALFILETPLSIKSLIRIQFPWQFAFAFVVGIGLLNLRRRVGSTAFGRLLVGTLVVLLVVTPLVAVDNYYGLDPRPTAETSFSEAEFSELKATEEFVSQRDAQITGLHETRLVMSRFGTTDLERGIVRNDRMILPAGHFIYRSGFPDNKLSLTTGTGSSLYSNDIYMSETWLSTRVERANHVYTAGGTGTLWSPTERPLD